MKNSRKKFLRNIFLILMLIYVVYTLFVQQQTLNKYDNESDLLSSQINEQEKYKEELAKKQEDINSEEFIESVAREKLDMYLPNEKVYIDTGM